MVHIYSRMRGRAGRAWVVGRPGFAFGLRGLGLPREDATRGDLYATVRIRTPGSVSAEERALWEQLARISKFKPRSENHE